MDKVCLVLTKKKGVFSLIQLTVKYEVSQYIYIYIYIYIYFFCQPVYIYIYLVMLRYINIHLQNTIIKNRLNRLKRIKS